MDVIVQQIQEYTKGREVAIATLESQLRSLSEQEQELKNEFKASKPFLFPLQNTSHK
jgi:hypothetical protein